MANLTYKGSTSIKEYSSQANAITSNVIFSLANNAGGVAFDAATSPSGVTITCGDNPKNTRTTNFSDYSFISFDDNKSGIQFYGIKWFKDKFIVVGQNDNIYTSDLNGLNWTFRPHALYGTETIKWSSIAVSNNVAVIVGIDSLGRLVIQSSTDGITWIERTPWATYSFIGNQSSDAISDIIVYDGSRFIIITQSSLLLISTDNGSAWSTNSGVNDAVGYTYSAEWRIFYTNGKYIASAPGRILTSINGTTWTSYGVNGPIDGGFSQNFLKIISIGNLYFALAFSTEYLSTDQGATWTKITNIVDYGSHRLAYQYENNKILILGLYENKTTISSISAVYNYGTSSPVVTSTIAKSAPLNAIEFDSNIKSLDAGKVEISGYTPADTLYANSTGAISKRPIGVDGSLLTPVSSSPVWALIDYSNATVQEYTTAGSFTWTKPIGVKMVYVYLIAGGGGGGGGAMYAGSSSNAVAFGGGGGGAGGLIETLIDAQSLSSTETIVVGTGGAGGTGAYQLGNLNSATAGASGQNSSFGIIFAHGGGGGSAGIAVESPNTTYTVNGGSCGTITLYGSYAPFLQPTIGSIGTSGSTLSVDEYYSMGVGGDTKLNFSISGTVQYGETTSWGKAGKNAPGGGGAGGCYIKLSGSAITKFAGDGGGGYRAGTFTEVSRIELKNSDYETLYTSGQDGISANSNTFPVGGGAWYPIGEGSPGNASGGGPGSGGPGGASGGYTLSFSGAGAGGVNHGAGGGGGGGCYALSGASSRAGNGGAGSRGRVIVVSLF